MRNVSFLELGFNNQTYFIVFLYSATNSGPSSNSQFYFQSLGERYQCCVTSAFRTRLCQMLKVFQHFDKPCSYHRQGYKLWKGVGSTYIALALGSVRDEAMIW
jgi:hypothetical protein